MFVKIVVLNLAHVPVVIGEDLQKAVGIAVIGKADIADSAALFLFGDLTVLDRWDISKLVEWADTHAFELTLVSIVSPVISLLLFYVSYRITTFFYERKEGIDE